MCAKYTWESFGGLPRWNTADANAVVAKARAAGVLHTDTHPPRGAIVLWTSPRHGHMCLSLGGDMIISTDYPNNRDTGEAHLSMPHSKWGHTYAGWLDSYAGVKFTVGETGGTMPTNDDFISLKETGVHKVRTNTDIHIDIAGHTNWEAETPSGRHLLALYANVDLPAPGTPERDALWYGGIRTWYNQIPENDITGLNGPIPCARFGDQHQLIAHTWPHTVDRSNWEFCLRLYAFDAQGHEMNFEVELETREVKIIGDKT
jgi:hypothetical protein